MKVGYLKRHRMTLIPTAILLLGSLVLSILVFSSDGYPVRQVNLNDGGIWVTSAKDQLFGRLNKPAGSLDAAMNPTSASGASNAGQLDVRQSGAAVVAWDEGAGKLFPIDVKQAAIASDHAVPISSGEIIGLAGGTLAILDPTTGKVWGQQVDPDTGITDLGGVDPTSAPLAKIDLANSSTEKQQVSLAVGQDGTVHVVSTTGQALTIKPARVGFDKPQVSKLDVALRSVQVTSVGSRVVVLDVTAGNLVLPNGKSVRVDRDVTSAVLQAPSSTGSSVVVATTTALLSFDLGSGLQKVLFDGPTNGTPTQPTWLGDCVYAAWAAGNGSPGAYQHSCSGARATPGNVKNLTNLVKPVFRVNRSSIVLNDLTTGFVLDLDSGNQVDNWQNVKPPPIADKNTNSQNNNPAPNQQDLPPKPADDILGARPGRTTVLHVLDNDSDPQGNILSISSAVLDRTEVGTAVAVAPDGQAVAVTLPPDSNGTNFKYTVNNGKGQSETASVDVEAHGPSENSPPNLRNGFVPHNWSVAAGGTLSLPVLGDWRDPDGDPVVLSAATVPTGSVTTTSDGRMVFTAPATAGPTTVTYQVSDGIQGSEPVSAPIDVNVLDALSTTTIAAIAEPDVARGVVGQPITIHPLDNDLPGADPTNAAAVVAIAGQVASPEGTTVTTDVKNGTITVVTGRPGTFQLSYSAAFGNAPFSAPQNIRVDAVPAPDSSEPPVAMPDLSVLRGQAPNVVDVLANDFNPAGKLLVVQSANPVSTDGQLQVAVVQGRWLRVNALTPTISPNPQLIRYTITDGITSAATGEVTVTQIAPPEKDTPVPQDDYAIVRAGDSVSVPVLDNDTDPGGDPITLVPIVTGAPNPGQLTVNSASGATADTGKAYVSGALVRYVPPTTVPSQQTVIIDYVVQDPAGDQATGHLHVTVMPAPTKTTPDLPPTPQPIEQRVVAGNAIVVRIPTYGVDPDGDSVAVTGIGSSPTLGRVVALGPTSITYEAFPTSAGTDSFTYQVIDRFNKTGQATIRIAVVPPGAPQAPVAVDDQITAAPGARLEVDVLTNDIFSVNDEVTITPAGGTDASFPDGVVLAGPTGPFEIKAPPADGKPLIVLYSLSNGIGKPSIAKLTVRSLADYNNPPRAFDVFTKPAAKATSVDVNVLSKSFDPEGSKLKLNPVPGATVKGAKVTLTVTGTPRAASYEIKDVAGAVASAVIHVPAVGAGAPYVKANTTIKLDKDATKTISLADYVVDPAGKSVRLTTTDQILGAPTSSIKVASKGDSDLTITALGGYVGPAAVSFEVTNGATLDAEGNRAFLTVPVQVGPETPVLRCPSDQITLVAGGNPVQVNVASVCHVWVADRSKLTSLKFNASWAKQVDGVSIGGSGSHSLSLSAAGSARPGDTGQITVGIPGTESVTSTLSVVVAAAPPPTVSPVIIDGFKVGATATIDLTSYVSSQLRDSNVTVVSVTKVSGGDATATNSGPNVKVTPGSDTSGVLEFTVIVSDIADTKRSDRHAIGAITMNVLNRPDPPTNVVPGSTVLSQVVQLSWTTPANNGAPIDYYLVESSGVSQQCSASPCTITGLTNGRDYAFTVKAHNLVDFSAPSAPSPTARPDALPEAVTNLTQTNPQDGSLTLNWAAARVDGTPVNTYRITWGNGGSASVNGSTLSYTPTGLINNNKYTFTVIPVNSLGAGPPATVQGQSAGKPATPKAPTFTATNNTSGNTRVVVLNWAAVDPNGIAPTSYIVTRTRVSNGSTTTIACADKTATTCQDPNIALDGTKYAYSITAQNAAAAADAPNHTSTPGPATTMEAATTPEPITGVTPQVVNATPDGKVPVTFNLGASHGASSTVSCSYSGGSCITPTSFPTAGQSGATLTLSFPAGWSGNFTLTNCNGSTGGDQTGSACNGGTQASAAANGPPSPPTGGRCAGDDGVNATFAWDAPPNIGARTIASYNVTGATTQSTTATSVTIGVAVDGQQRTVNVYAVDSAGEQSAGSTAVTCQNPSPPPPPPPPPPPTISAWQGNPGTATVGTCQDSGCNWLAFKLSDNFSSGSYKWECIFNGAVGYTSSSPRQWDAGQTYNPPAGENTGYCIFGGGQTAQIRINGVTSNGVPHS